MSARRLGIGVMALIAAALFGLRLAEYLEERLA
jgi:hypothetical protein